MELIPAIDLLEGKVVRLHKGRYDEVTVYADDPVAEAKRFADQGAKRLHVVDLEGARSGDAAHAALVERIVASVPSIAVQVGGGVRDARAAERWLAAGAQRVVMGTAAIKSPDVVSDLCAKHPGRLVIAIDARNGEVAIEGWEKGSGVRAEELAGRVDAWGAAAILYTDIDRDGTRLGPAVDSTAALQAAVSATVIASGGIGEIAHLLELARAGVRAAVCGRALYAGAFTLPEALAALSEGR
ncbi:1-(5-phosphoribosyl)-5-[(5-phosphoribosylamino)methylideneamino]imidazole-4-carboxamide isomerase [Sandaracinus amylolyticus]|uniref:1-(5-phosphoribosyl)-5-[(5-phosphoribosylamino)methylideneamino] imidazole-4-carboxamide isomerase n=1 Tax=Sandaracinus amylolyticus TaxID=927083 RepID=A0A0F6W3U5_9BACT|nr:1-(5-phosphoribosyl)-5-[(5-phosphoribosylamino)methylideneamino]imidazole-4-carboxamide isomerase [Sandaracinus amylolyticus]AKF06692.1 Phosphoribosylformimino-5-aminoimidazole carboxamide ribotide isomerase [Sandaracinus amylolyticus]